MGVGSRAASHCSLEKPQLLVYLILRYRIEVLLLPDDLLHFSRSLFYLPLQPVVQVPDAGLPLALRLLSVLSLRWRIAPFLELYSSKLAWRLVEVHLDTPGWTKLSLLAILSSPVAAMGTLLRYAPSSRRVGAGWLTVFRDWRCLLLLL